MAREQSRDHGRLEGRRVDWRQRQHRHADPQIRQDRQIPVPAREAGRARRQQRPGELLAPGENRRGSLDQ